MSRPPRLRVVAVVSMVTAGALALSYAVAISPSAFASTPTATSRPVSSEASTGGRAEKTAQPPREPRLDGPETAAPSSNVPAPPTSASASPTTPSATSSVPASDESSTKPTTTTSGAPTSAPSPTDAIATVPSPTPTAGDNRETDSLATPASTAPAAEESATQTQPAAATGADAASESDPSGWNLTTQKTFYTSASATSSAASRQRSFGVQALTGVAPDLVAFVVVRVESPAAGAGGEVTVGAGKNATVAVRFEAGQPVLSTAMVPVDADGTITLSTPQNAALAFTVTGWISRAAAAAGSPKLALDTTSVRNASLHEKSYLDVDVSDQIPDDVGGPGRAAVVALAVSYAGEPGFVTLTSTASAAADGGTLRVTPGHPAAVTAAVPLGADGTLRVFASTAVELELGVLGVIQGCAGVHVTAPVRVLDTREGDVFQRLLGGEMLSVQPLAFESASRSARAQAVVAVTPMATSGEGILTLGPSSASASHELDIASTRSRSHLLYVPMNSDGEIYLEATTPTDLVVDVLGFVDDAHSCAPGDASAPADDDATDAVVVPSDLATAIVPDADGDTEEDTEVLGEAGDEQASTTSEPTASPSATQDPDDSTTELTAPTAGAPGDPSSGELPANPSPQGPSTPTDAPPAGADQGRADQGRADQDGAGQDAGPPTGTQAPGATASGQEPTLPASKTPSPTATGPAATVESTPNQARSDLPDQPVSEITGEPAPAQPSLPAAPTVSGPNPDLPREAEILPNVPLFDERVQTIPLGAANGDADR